MPPLTTFNSNIPQVKSACYQVIFCPATYIFQAMESMRLGVKRYMRGKEPGKMNE
jgi:hypothetical protein